MIKGYLTDWYYPFLDRQEGYHHFFMLESFLSIIYWSLVVDGASSDWAKNGVNNPLN